jgi:neutral amino acid transport system permease protein
MFRGCGGGHQTWHSPVRPEVKKSPTGGNVAGVAKSLAFSRNARSFGIITLLVALFGFAFASPAFATEGETGTEYSDGISGVIRESGQPLEGVRLTVTGEGYSAEVVTGADGRWRIGVPAQGSYELALDETSLPEGLAVLDDSATRTVIVDSSGRAIVNFFLGEGVRQSASFAETLLVRVVNGLNFGLLLGLAAIGLSLVFGTTGLANFAHGEMVTIGAVGSLLATAAGVPIYLALPLGVVLGGAVGWSMDAGLFKPMRRRGVGIIQVMIVTIGLSLAVRYIIQFNIGGSTLFLPPLSTERVNFGPVSLGVTDLISMAISLVVLVIFAWWLMRTKTGKATRAISDNSSLAAASGIDVERVIRIVWVVAGMLAALAGVLWAYFRPGLRWDMGTQILLFIFAAGILGGLGTAFGALVGAIIVGVLVETSAILLPADLKYVGALVVMIVILLFRPQGILGQKERIG